MVTTAQWRRFKNGSVHLVWWCCGKQVGDPLPKERWAEFDIDPYEVAVARFTIAHDESWTLVP